MRLGPAVMLMIAIQAPQLADYLGQAKAYETAKQYDEAEAVLTEAKLAWPDDPAPYAALAEFYTRRGRFEQGVAVLRERTARQPGDPDALLAVAIALDGWIRADARLSTEDARRLATDGLGEIDAALAVRPEFSAALGARSGLLRTLASLERDPERRKSLLAEAAAARGRATELERPAEVAKQIEGWTRQDLAAEARRVGGSVRPPIKVKHVDAQHPDEARRAGIQGVVILEALIDRDGSVADARVLRSIPLLDRPALEAVRQWEYQFEPPVDRPVIMTVTVSFNLR